MDNKNLFKEAIADAKAVREAALANAKAALEEALTPRLQSMLATKLQEMDYDEEVSDLEDAEEEMEEGFVTSHGDDSDENLDFNLEEEMEDESMDEDFDLSEILAELNEAKEKEEKEKEESEEENVADMSVEDLKALIKDIVSQEIEAEEAEGPEAEAEEEAGEEPMNMGGEEESEEINLDELLAELDAMGNEEEMEEGLGDMMKKAGSAIKKGVQKVTDPITGNDCKRQFPKWETDQADDYNACLRSKGFRPHVQGAAFGARKEATEMNEAIKTINTLRNELNEVNLLNAKLLYVNKIFKAKNLSESQKLKVIASFDKATTAKEAKVVFESLNSTLTTAAPKQAIKESIGFASRAAGNAPRKAIVETNDAITRMQKLANIIK